jgi:hypothetical protein
MIKHDMKLYDILKQPKSLKSLNLTRFDSLIIPIQF